MWWSEEKLNRKTAHFRLSSAAQKRCMLKLSICQTRRTFSNKIKQESYPFSFKNKERSDQNFEPNEWNDLTVPSNELTWNEMTMERSDRKPIYSRVLLI